MQKKITVLDIPAAIKNHLASFCEQKPAFGMLDFQEGVHPDNFAILSNDPKLRYTTPIKTDFYNVVLCLRGSCKKTLGHFIFEVYPNSIHLDSPGLISSIEDASEDLLLYQVLFKKDFLTNSFLKENIMENLLEVNPDYAPIYGIAENHFAAIKGIYERINHEINHPRTFHQQIIKLLIVELLYEMNRACESCLVNSTRHLNKQYQLVFKFKKLIDQHYLTLRTVQEYADLLFVTAKYLTQVVKSETTLNALSLIHNRLFQEAQYLLLSSGLSVKEISDQLGFDNASHFSRFFKRFSGTNPSEFKVNEMQRTVR